MEMNLPRVKIERTRRIAITLAVALPYWRPLSLAVDPDSGRTALVLFGKADSLTTSCGA
jgi:hypothetical protein